MGELTAIEADTMSEHPQIWEWNGRSWRYRARKMDIPVNGKDEDGPAIPAGAFVLGLADGRVHVVKKKIGTTIELSAAAWKVDGVALSAKPIADNLNDVTLSVVSEPDHVQLRLEEHTVLGPLLRSLPAGTAVSAKLAASRGLTFSCDSLGWQADLSEAFDDIRSPTSLSFNGANDEVQAKIAWSPEASLEFSHDEHRVRIVDRDVANDAAEQELILRCREPLPPATRAEIGGELVECRARAEGAYVLGRGGVPLSVDEFFSLGGGRMRLCWAGLSCDFDWADLTPPRVYFSYNKQQVQLVEVSPGSAGWHLGPRVPYFLGSGERCVAYSAANDQIVNLRTITQGGLPNGFKADQRYPFLLRRRGRDEYGVLTSACDIPEGQWVGVSRLEAAERTLICWQGIVDWVTVKPVLLVGKTRYLVLLESGFPLTPDFCLPAPFGGVAMKPAGAEWRPLHRRTGAGVSRRDGSWSVSGRLVLIDTAAGTASLSGAIAIEQGWDIMLLGTANPAIVSGPVISLAPATEVPRLKGFLSDENQCIRVMTGELPVGAPTSSDSWTGTLHDAYTPETVQRVLDDAHRAETVQRGRVDRWDWTRLGPDTYRVEDRAALVPGIYKLRSAEAH